MCKTYTIHVSVFPYLKFFGNVELYYRNKVIWYGTYIYTHQYYLFTLFYYSIDIRGKRVMTLKSITITVGLVRMSVRRKLLRQNSTYYSNLLSLFLTTKPSVRNTKLMYWGV